MQRIVNNNAKELKDLVLRFFRDCLEEEVWMEFSDSLSNRGFYKHYDYDIPLLRDLKAFINMVESVKRLTDQYPLRVLALFELPEAYFVYKHSYSIWASTEGVLTHYMEHAGKYTKETVIPLIYSKIRKLYELCSRANLDKACIFFTKQMLRLENYKKNYLLIVNKQVKESEEKSDLTDDLLKTLQEQNENLLKKFYKDKFDVYFKKETKKDDKDNLRLFLELEQDKDETVKNLKKLSNGIIGIRQFLHDYDSYSQSHALSKLFWMPTLYTNLRATFSLIQEFKYKAIMAEQANPIVEYIKKFLEDLANKLEQMACYIDEVEGMMHFREGFLLRYVGELIDQYNKVVNDLKIPIDFSRQKRIYLKARLERREKMLEAVDFQLREINKFLRHKNYPIASLPRQTLIDLQEFVIKFSDDIPIDREKFAKYKEYLAMALERTSRLSAEGFIQLPFVYAGNYLALTIHAEVMAAFSKMHLYLRRERYYLSQKVERAKTFNVAHPFDHFKSSDLRVKEHKQLILNALRNRTAELNSEKERSFLKLTLKSEDSKEVKDEPKVGDMISERMTTQVKEEGIIGLAAEKCEAGEDISLLLEWMSKEDAVGHESRALLHEIDQVLKQPRI